jgi:hypothetical protein
MQIGYVVYKITFPNGKIYVGKDIGGNGHSLNYFGSWNTKLVEADFTNEQQRNFTIHKEILFESESKHEISKMESQLILELRANDPSIGYNQSHRPRTSSKSIDLQEK